MRLCEREKQNVIVFACLGILEDTYTWGKGTYIRAAVYPAGERIAPKVYGEEKQDARLMLYDGSLPLRVGMGVSLDGGKPAYRIVSLENWSHVRAVLESIPEAKR